MRMFNCFVFELKEQQEQQNSKFRRVFTQRKKIKISLILKKFSCVRRNINLLFYCSTVPSVPSVPSSKS